MRVMALASVGEKSGVPAKTYVTGPKLILRRHALLQALLIASFAMSWRAEAACTPASPVNNTIVTCIGKTTNQNGTNGYGTVNDNNNTYNIQAGATVTGDGFGVVFGTGATVNNDGTITGGIGISGSDATINNTSTGVITGDTNGIQATTATVRNAGLISAMGVSATGGNGFGVSADTADVNNTSTGHITGTFSGIGTSTLAAIDNAGAISGGRLGIIGDTARVINAGAITRWRHYRRRRRHFCQYRQRDQLRRRHHIGWDVRHCCKHRRLHRQRRHHLGQDRHSSRRRRHHYQLERHHFYRRRKRHGDQAVERRRHADAADRIAHRRRGRHGFWQ